MYIEPTRPGFTLGADPEFFIQNPEGKVVSAHDLLPGTKVTPFAVKGGAVQVDGTAGEFNINPSSTFEEFNANIVSVLREVWKMLPKGYTISKKPYNIYSEEDWDKIPDHAKELGCSPDFNAWTGDVNTPPKRPNEGPLSRLCTAAGHLHYGWTEDASMADSQHIRNCKDIVKQSDYIFGPWSCLKDKDPTRRALYGKAGAFRPKPYGAEYRVLGNFWVFSQALHLEVWNRANLSVNLMSKTFYPEKYHQYNDFLVETINDSRPEPFFNVKYFKGLKVYG